MDPSQTWVYGHRESKIRPPRESGSKCLPTMPIKRVQSLRKFPSDGAKILLRNVTCQNDDNAYIYSTFLVTETALMIDEVEWLSLCNRPVVEEARNTKRENAATKAASTVWACLSVNLTAFHQFHWFDMLCYIKSHYTNVIQTTNLQRNPEFAPCG